MCVQSIRHEHRHRDPGSSLDHSALKVPTRGSATTATQEALDHVMPYTVSHVVTAGVPIVEGAEVRVNGASLVILLYIQSRSRSTMSVPRALKHEETPQAREAVIEIASYPFAICAVLTTSAHGGHPYPLTDRGGTPCGHAACTSPRAPCPRTARKECPWSRWASSCGSARTLWWTGHNELRPPMGDDGHWRHSLTATATRVFLGGSPLTRPGPR
ncbi:hypothetical protein BD413DRAFT_248347 [Trametes elegans]|nr:hypothetical protein BD413DRAFT_248347 [Trametes elegans]